MPNSSFVNPEEIVKNLTIQPGYQVADFGSGAGFYALIIARLVGPDGLVTAIDVLQNKLDTVKTNAQAQGLFNLSYVRGNLEVLGGSTLPDSSQDLVLVANILFQSQQKAEILREAHRILKTGGELMVVEWEIDSNFGSQEAGWKISKAEAEALINGLGFMTAKELPAANNHWGLLFKKI